MMKQPDLGKTIAELRKAKGYTQDELVEKCKLNVRTLQRIESGEVSPRSYTIKLIFTALEYTVDNSLKSAPNKFMILGLRIFKWPGQVYPYVLDLFNLKTNTMKKLMILSTPFLLLCAVLLFSYNSNAKAQAKTALREKLEKTSSNARFMQLFNSGQIDSISMRYLDNACMMADQTPTTFSKKNIYDYFMKLHRQGFRFSKMKSTAMIISDSLAIDRGEWAIDLNSVVVATGTYLTQWHYLNGNWRIENEMSKSDHAENQVADK
jgi:transcriptional regulator with XRE-family HTH domain